MLSMKLDDINNAIFNFNDIRETIKANGLQDTKRVHEGTDNQDTIGDLLDDLEIFLLNTYNNTIWIGVRTMSYVLAQLNFVKVDDEGNEETDSKGNVITYVPKGRWKELEYLCEDRDDDDFEVEKTDES